MMPVPARSDLFRLPARGVLPVFTAFAAAIFLGPLAHAATILADGGFESAGSGNVYYAGDTIDGGSWTVTAGSVYVETMDPYVYAGNNSLNLTYVNPYVSNSISQIIATTAGQNYVVSFYANADTANIFSLSENGVTVTSSPSSIANKGFPGAVTNSNLFTYYTGSFFANSASTTLNFASTGNPPLGSSVGSVLIDNVAVAATPEPASLALVFTGAAGLAGLIRRRRAA